MNPIFIDARETLKAAGELLDRLEAQVAQARLLGDQANRERGEREAERAAHEQALAEATAKHRAECDARKKELAVQSAELAEREHTLAAERQRVNDRERWVEHRAADMQLRLTGAA